MTTPTKIKPKANHPWSQWQPGYLSKDRAKSTELRPTNCRPHGRLR